jgi:hypothetical protein
MNRFLSDYSDKMRYVDLKYSVVQTHAGMNYTVILIFETDSSRSHFFI